MNIEKVLDVNVSHEKSNKPILYCYTPRKSKTSRMIRNNDDDDDNNNNNNNNNNNIYPDVLILRVHSRLSL